MKLPKGFGGSGFQGVLQQAQSAMARAQNLDAELESERLPIDKGPIKMMFNGLGELQGIKIDPSIVDPQDVEALEDMIVGAVRDGFNLAKERRDAKTKEIMGDLPNIPGLSG